MFKETIAKCKAKDNDEAKVIMDAPDSHAETKIEEPDRIDLNPDVQKFADDLTRIAYFRTLVPHNCKPDVFHTRLEFYSYSNLGFVISDLMKIAMHTLYKDGPQYQDLIVLASHTLLSLPDRQCASFITAFPVNSFKIVKFDRNQ